MKQLIDKRSPLFFPLVTGADEDVDCYLDRCLEIYSRDLVDAHARDHSRVVETGPQNHLHNQMHTLEESLRDETTEIKKQMDGLQSVLGDLTASMRELSTAQAKTMAIASHSLYSMTQRHHLQDLLVAMPGVPGGSGVPQNSLPSPAHAPVPQGGLFSPKLQLMTADSEPSEPELMQAMMLAASPASQIRGLRVFRECTGADDRCVLTAGPGFCFAGLYGGHGGDQAAAYAEKFLFSNLCVAAAETAAAAAAAAAAGVETAAEATKDSFRNAGDVLATAIASTDVGFLAASRAAVVNGQPIPVLFAGASALAALVLPAEGRILVAGVGDSRAVAGIAGPSGFETVELSALHTVAEQSEHDRLHKTHPGDRRLFVNRQGTAIVDDSRDAADPHTARGVHSQIIGTDNFLLKGLAFLTRSIGDCHLKDRGAAMVFNTYSSSRDQILPAPGDRGSGLVAVPPYVTSDADVFMAKVPSGAAGFLLLASRAVWDEMSPAGAPPPLPSFIPAFGSAPLSPDSLYSVGLSSRCEVGRRHATASRGGPGAVASSRPFGSSRQPSPSHKGEGQPAHCPAPPS